MVARVMASWGIELIDCQQQTEHLARFGAEGWPRLKFTRRVAELVKRPTRPGPWNMSP